MPFPRSLLASRRSTAPRACRRAARLCDQAPVPAQQREAQAQARLLAAGEVEGRACGAQTAPREGPLASGLLRRGAVPRSQRCPAVRRALSPAVHCVACVGAYRLCGGRHSSLLLGRRPLLAAARGGRASLCQPFTRWCWGIWSRRAMRQRSPGLHKLAGATDALDATVRSDRHASMSQALVLTLAWRPRIGSAQVTGSLCRKQGSGCHERFEHTCSVGHRHHRLAARRRITATRRRRTRAATTGDGSLARRRISAAAISGGEGERERERTGKGPASMQ